MTNYAELIETLRNLEIQQNQITNQTNEIRNQIANENIRTENEINQAVDRVVGYINQDEPLVQTEFQQVKNVIITSPTQMGKTKYVIDACKSVSNLGYLIVISCDNSLSQLAQLNSRLEREEVLYYTLKNANPFTICEHIKTGRSVVLTLINNPFSITKLQKNLLIIQTHSTVNKHVFFHDEADTLNKADKAEDISNNKIAISHRKWIQTVRILENSSVPVKRFWISATPENCSNISRITGRDILVLPQDRNYIGVNHHVDWDIENEEALGDEIGRIRNLNNGEVILYCVDKKNTEQLRTAMSISREYSCITCCHNMTGSSLFLNGEFIRCIDRSVAISDVLETIKTRYVNIPLVVVGFNIMNRAISFVSSGRNNPYTATVLFYTSSKTSHIVGIAQRFGRVCGTSRPDLTRRVVYCDSQVYQDYSGYISNQNKAWDVLDTQENQSKTICSILLECDGVVSLKRPLDRPALKLVNQEYSHTTSSSGIIPLENNEDKMKRLVRRWKNEVNETSVARLFRDMINNNGRLESNLVETYFDNIQSVDSLTRHHDNMWCSVFSKNETHHYIKQEALEYYNSL